MKKSIIRFIAVFMVLVIIAATPAIMALFAKKIEQITLTVVNSSSSEKIEEYPAYTSSQEFVDEMTVIAENEKYRLYMHETLTAVALFDKHQDIYYLSNPFDVEVNGSDTDTIRNRQRSQIVLTYLDEEGNSTELNSFSDCIAKQQFTIETLANGVQVQMMLGEAGNQYLLPEIMTSETMQSLLDAIDEDNQFNLEDSYSKITIQGVSEDIAGELLKKYPYLEKEDLYSLRTVSNRIKKRLSTALEEAGLTREQITAEYEKIGYEINDKTPAFTLTVQYQLDEDGLNVSIPLESVSYQSKYYQVDTIAVLPYFGCGQLADTTGELLIPDGSGAIMKYNSDLTKRLTALSMAVYGQDAAAVSDYTDVSTSKQVRMPVFGNTNQNSSYLAVIENGESVCSITASSGDSTDQYPTVYATANYRYNELFYYEDKDFSKNVMAYAETFNKGTVSIKYLPLKAESNYVDMAFAYKDYLIGREQLSRQTVTPRLILQLLGYCNNEDGTFALTTFEDAVTIMDELNAGGVSALALRYLGWTSGGLNNYYTDTVDFASVMGGKKGWSQLTAAATQSQVDLYMDMELSYVRRTTLFDRFSANGDACRNIRNFLCGKYTYDYGDNNIDRSSLIYGVTSSKMLEDIGRLNDSLQSALGNAKVSVGSLGNTLTANFKKDSIVTRPEAETKILSVLEKLSAEDNVMLENANAYTLPYCDSIVNLEVTSSSYDSTDYDVPFYQLVVNGCVEYSADPINESEDTQNALLKAFETGASISYIAAYRNQDQLKNSTQSQYYSVRYDVIKEELTDVYHEYMAGMEKLGNGVIADHQTLSKDVYLTTYSNGAKVVVNYGDQAYLYENQNVASEGYWIVEGSV